MKQKNYNGKQYDYQTCFFIPDNHLDNSFLKYYKLVYVDPLIEILIMSTANSFDTNQNSSSIKSNLKESPKRRLQSRNLQYELIVEDKYGKKLKYSGDKEEPEVIEEGTQGDKIYGSSPYNDNDDDGDDSKMTINFKLLLIIASLILIAFLILCSYLI